MIEDIGIAIMIGVSVTMVAAIVATALNLMVMSNSLMSGGQTTLQSGIDAISQQEFAAYNNSKVSGTQVTTALNLFQGRDIAILVQTKSFKTLVCPTATDGEGTYMNYGALISTSQTGSQATKDVETLCASNKDTIYGSNKSKLYATEVAATGKPVTRASGQPNFTALLYDDAGIIQSSANTIGTNTTGNPQLINSAARFQSVLIKDSTGTIIGIAFYQID